LCQTYLRHSEFPVAGDFCGSVSMQNSTKRTTREDPSRLSQGIERLGF
jgi:hypothetical protein